MLLYLAVLCIGPKWFPPPHHRMKNWLTPCCFPLPQLPTCKLHTMKKIYLAWQPLNDGPRKPLWRSLFPLESWDLFSALNAHFGLIKCCTWGRQAVKDWFKWSQSLWFDWNEVWIEFYTIVRYWIPLFSDDKVMLQIIIWSNINMAVFTWLVIIYNTFK